MISLKLDLQLNLPYQQAEFTSHKATYLADVLVVAAAAMASSPLPPLQTLEKGGNTSQIHGIESRIDLSECWRALRLKAITVEGNGTFSRPIMGQQYKTAIGAAVSGLGAGASAGSGGDTSVDADANTDPDADAGASEPAEAALPSELTAGIPYCKLDFEEFDGVECAGTNTTNGDSHTFHSHDQGQNQNQNNGVFREFNTDHPGLIELIGCHLEVLVRAWYASSSSSSMRQFGANFAPTTTAAATTTNTNHAIWGCCHIWHDSFLNDVDDLPAIALARAVTAAPEENFHSEQGFFFTDSDADANFRHNHNNTGKGVTVPKQQGRVGGL